MALRAETADQRQAIYQNLARHNRIVRLLRFAVPALGVLVFLLLAVQLYIASEGQDVPTPDLTIDRTMAMVQAPRYAGVMSDGTAYRVVAGEARTAVEASNVIQLLDTSIVFTNPDATTTTGQAQKALLNTQTQNINIEGQGTLSSSDGTLGQFAKTVIDWPGQTFTSLGGTTLLFEDGTTLKSETSRYDLATAVWTFSRVTVTMPSTPGELTAPSQTEPTP